MKYQPGQSGNPSGRPLNSLNRKTLARQKLEAHVPVLVEAVNQLILTGDERTLGIAIRQIFS